MPADHPEPSHQLPTVLVGRRRNTALVFGRRVNDVLIVADG